MLPSSVKHSLTTLDRDPSLNTLSKGPITELVTLYNNHKGPLKSKGTLSKSGKNPLMFIRLKLTIPSPKRASFMFTNTVLIMCLITILKKYFFKSELFKKLKTVTCLPGQPKYTIK